METSFLRMRRRKPVGRKALNERYSIQQVAVKSYRDSLQKYNARYRKDEAVDRDRAAPS